MYNLDTHKLVESFIARGVPKEQAEVFVEAGVIIAKAQFDNFAKDYSNLATKDDLKVFALELRNEFKSDILELRDEVKSDITELKGEIIGMKKDISFNRMLLWLIATAVFIPLLQNTLIPLLK